MNTSSASPSSKYDQAAIDRKEMGPGLQIAIIGHGKQSCRAKPPCFANGNTRMCLRVVIFVEPGGAPGPDQWDSPVG